MTALNALLISSGDSNKVHMGECTMAKGSMGLLQ